LRARPPGAQSRHRASGISYFSMSYAPATSFVLDAENLRNGNLGSFAGSILKRPMPSLLSARYPECFGLERRWARPSGRRNARRSIEDFVRRLT
jgi:hypothetical protein